MKWLALLRADVYRLRCTRGGWAALLAPALVGGLRILGSSVSQRLDLTRRAAQDSDFDPTLMPVVNGFGPLADGLRTGGFVLALVALLLGALLIVRERENGVLGLGLLAGSRFSLLVGKLLALCLVLVLSSGLLFCVCYLTTSTLFGLEDVVEEGYVMATARELLSDVVLAWLAALPAWLAAGSFGLLLSTVTATTGAAVGATVVPFLLADLLLGMLGEGARWVFITYVPSLGEESTLARLTEVARAYSDAGWRDGELMHAALVPGVEFLALFGLAALCLHFKKE